MSFITQSSWLLGIPGIWEVSLSIMDYEAIFYAKSCPDMRCPEGQGTLGTFGLLAVLFSYALYWIYKYTECMSDHQYSVNTITVLRASVWMLGYLWINVKLSELLCYLCPVGMKPISTRVMWSNIQNEISWWYLTSHPLPTDPLSMISWREYAIQCRSTEDVPDTWLISKHTVTLCRYFDCKWIFRLNTDGRIFKRAQAQNLKNI